MDNCHNVPTEAPGNGSEWRDRVRHRLQALGLSERALRAASKSDRTLKALEEAFDLACFSERDGLPDASAVSDRASLLYTAVMKLAPAAAPYRAQLFVAVGDGRVDNNAKLDAACEYLTALGKAGTATPESLDVAAFNDACGAGVHYDDEALRAAVEAELQAVRSELLERRYAFPVGVLMAAVNKRLRFADGKRVKAAIDRGLEQVLGPRQPADDQPAKGASNSNSSTVKKTRDAPQKLPRPQPVTDAAREEDERLAHDPLSALPETFEARDLASMRNTPELLEAQRRHSGGCAVITRFPPEPNAHLHCGHTKAMLLDFGYAMRHGGRCILRFDDTNPEAEDIEYIRSIIEAVHWMGYRPHAITHSSDYFDQLYELALELIRRGKAYVCHQSADQMAAYRESKRHSPWRDRPVEENLHLFNRMRQGVFEEGAATLRMKIDMQHPNPSMRDPVAYRIKYVPHPHVGDRWCIYPSYDFTHCLVDSLEWVTHSLCTLEFEVRRDSYYWLLEALDMYRPYVFEFSRLNLSHTVLSKRRLTQIVERGLVRGWDDPRMPTLVGMRRRGYRPQAINHFVASVGFSRAENNVSVQKLEACVRRYMDEHAPRRMVVLDPLRVVIENWDALLPADDTAGLALQVPNHPKRPEMGTYALRLTRVIYVDRSDFRLQDEKDYYGLAPGKGVLLRHSGQAIRVVGYEPPDAADVARVHTLRAQLVLPTSPSAPGANARPPKFKGVLHWTSAASAVCECRLYSHMFRHENPLEAIEDVNGEAAAPSDWLHDFDPHSEVVLSQARCEPSPTDWQAGNIFQFERVGFFCVDPDSRPLRPAATGGDTATWHWVFNRTVTLRESYKKFA
ncbi:hypothetical protein CDCA_CDCA06G1910 [Cyanidium caldarium]|uniref:glutamine--tRNA ligase n=1 Tax=Cyanidium caldarium TaxID=2771 RepID=A0AAV9IUX7_CYACA|nr:hypothetical protein CDCA_CDCA06G1910 [Cyanidium caldarium]